VGDHARAEDITQEVFLAALRRMRQTDGPILLKPWLYEIAKNASIDHFRRSRRAEEVSYEGHGLLGPADYDRLVAPAPGPDAAVDTKHQLDNLCGAFGSLSDIHHEVLILRELEGRSYREIGERLGLTRPAVESTLFRARRRLTQEYDELASGRRCARIQGAIALVARTGDLGSRDLNRMAKHLSLCRDCRRQAAALGVSDSLLGTRRRGMARVAALIAWPVLVLRRWDLPHRPAGWWRGPTPMVRAPQWSAGLYQTGDSLAMVWSKLVVSAVAVAALSMGATGLPGAAPRVVHAPVARPAVLASGIVAPVRQVVRAMWTPGHLAAGLRGSRWISFSGRRGPGASRLRSSAGDTRLRPAAQGARPGERARSRGGGGGDQGSLGDLSTLYGDPGGHAGVGETVRRAVGSAPSALEHRGRSAAGSALSHASSARRAFAAGENAVAGARGSASSATGTSPPGAPVSPGTPPPPPR
jgi:RNA polymerase sigma factor (sigma-70 family)